MPSIGAVAALEQEVYLKDEIRKEGMNENSGKVFDAEKYSSNPELLFRDISNERYRTYIFPPAKPGWPNVEITIYEPEAVSTKGPETWVAGGSHRVVCKNGMSYYIPRGWVGIQWEVRGKYNYGW